MAEDFLRDNLKHPGNLVVQATPEHFILSLTSFEKVSSKDGSTPKIAESSASMFDFKEIHKRMTRRGGRYYDQYTNDHGNRNEDWIVQFLDLKDNWNYFRIPTDQLADFFNTDWYGISMEALEGVGTYDGDLTQNSLIAIKLPSQYDNIRLNGETQGPRNMQAYGVHWFNYSRLIPYKCGSFRCYFFGNATEIPDLGTICAYMNDGRAPARDLGPLGTHGGTTGIYLGGFSLDPTIDYQQENVNLIFNYDMEGLVHIYDNNTPYDYTDDIVTLNPSNPFPITITTKKQEAPQAQNSPTTSNPPGPVSMVCISGRKNSDLTLQWLNPPDTDFDSVQIYRRDEDKQEYEFLEDTHIPVFVDKTADPSKEYEYRLTAYSTHSEEPSAPVYITTQDATKLTLRSK